MDLYLKGGQSNIIRLKTAISTSTPILLGQVGTLKGLIWNGASTGEKLALQNKDGSPIVEITAVTGTLSPIIEMNLNIPFVEIHCDDFDAGTVLLYLGVFMSPDRA